ncbi:MAG: ATP-dependent Clp protease ATP-binding subunit [Butyricicoccaceae bacterium]
MAGSFGHSYVGTEHLLLGLAHQKQSIAGQMLSAAGVSVRKVKRQAGILLGRGVPDRGAPLGMSLRLSQVVSSAAGTAERCGKPMIGTDHLLTALLSCRDTTARKILEEIDADLNTLERMAGMTAAEPKEVAMNQHKLTVLPRYASDLTGLAQAGRLDPVIGRERELERVLAVLCRRTKNNPVLLGEPGVGKTAVAEALAQQIVSGKVPRALTEARVYSLDVSAMVAGTKYRGEFEERMRQIIEELAGAPEVIVFIDEMHLLTGAGAAEGSVDAANALKPALARGELRMIGATTPAEYHKYIEKDAALDRRFQKIMVEEPTPEQAERILCGLVQRYEAHHRVHMSPELLHLAVEYSVRFLSERYLPDKAIDLMDEACAAVSLQGRHMVKKSDLLHAVSVQTGVDERELAHDEDEALRTLEESLSARVTGQDAAVQTVVRAMRRRRSGLEDGVCPQSFLFLGPTGVGKTELCRALADVLMDGSLIRLDLSEYREGHSISRLIGAPPGYAGYGEGGQLTEKIRKKPFSCVVFDEAEKAHPDVLKLLLQILEEGVLTDSEGRKADFRHAVIVLTGNIGQELSAPVGFGADCETRGDQIKSAARGVLSPELYARIGETVVFGALRPEHCRTIAQNELNRLKARCKARGVTLEWTEQAVDCVAVCDSKRGARAVRDAVRRQAADVLAEHLIAAKHTPRVLCLDAENGKIVLREMVAG